MTEAEEGPTEGIDSIVSEMITLNSNIINGLRGTAKDVELIKEAFLIQAARCDEIIELLAVNARMTADRIGDIVTAEWDLEEQFPDDDPEEEPEDE